MNLLAIIPSGQTEITVNGLHQWDYGRKLEIHSNDLPALIEVHFACRGMTEAVVRSCAVTNGVATADIPDLCLEQTTPIVAWVYAINGTSAKTACTIIMPIIARAKPAPSATIPTSVSDKYTELITAVNTQVGALTDGSMTVAKSTYAESAGSATTAQSATSATHATSADSAARATLADAATEAGIAHYAYLARATESGGMIKYSCFHSVEVTNGLGQLSAESGMIANTKGTLYFVLFSNSTIGCATGLLYYAGVEDHASNSGAYVGNYYLSISNAGLVVIGSGENLPSGTLKFYKLGEEAEAEEEEASE